MRLFQNKFDFVRRDVCDVDSFRFSVQMEWNRAGYVLLQVGKMNPNLKVIRGNLLEARERDAATDFHHGREHPDGVVGRYVRADDRDFHRFVCVGFDGNRDAYACRFERRAGNGLQLERALDGFVAFLDFREYSLHIPKCVEYEVIRVHLNRLRADGDFAGNFNARSCLDRAVEDDRKLLLRPFAVRNVDCLRLELDERSGCDELFLDAAFDFRLADGEASRLLLRLHVRFERGERPSQRVVQQDAPFVFHLDGDDVGRCLRESDVGGDVFVFDRNLYLYFVCLLEALHEPKTKRKQDEAQKNQGFFPLLSAKKSLDFGSC